MQFVSSCTHTQAGRQTHTHTPTHRHTHTLTHTLTHTHTHTHVRTASGTRWSLIGPVFCYFLHYCWLTLCCPALSDSYRARTCSCGGVRVGLSWHRQAWEMWASLNPIRERDRGAEGSADPVAADHPRWEGPCGPARSGGVSPVGRSAQGPRCLSYNIPTGPTLFTRPTSDSMPFVVLYKCRSHLKKTIWKTNVKSVFHVVCDCKMYK